MVYNNVSIDRVIGKILRDTRLNDLSYTADMPEWIGEVLRGTLGTKQFAFKTTRASICFYKAKLPCMMMVLDAVVYKGSRLRFRDIEGFAGPTVQHANEDIWQSVPNPHPTRQAPMNYWGAITKLPYENTGIWYGVEPGYLVLPIEKGEVDIWYRAMPHDERGLPMIPDNQHLMDAIYWYVRAKLIGTGWQDPVYKLDDRICMERYAMANDRATSSMDFSTPDMMAGIGDATLRFYPPQDYWETLSNHISLDNAL